MVSCESAGAAAVTIFYNIYGTWPLTDTGVEVESAVPEVLLSSSSWRRSGEGVVELKSKRRGRGGAVVH